MTYYYDEIVWYDADNNPVTTQKKLIIETEIGKCIDAEVPNPSGSEDAYYYGISIDWGLMQYQAFTPWAEWHQQMNEWQANKFLGEAITQTIANYKAYA